MDLKKSALALLALGLTGVANAGGFVPPAACSNHPVTVPCERSAWDLGFTAFWSRPTADNFTFSTVSNNSNISALYISPKYKFGFAVEGSYHWSTGNDLTLNWTRYHKSFDRVFVDSSDEDSVSAGNFDVDFDAVNLELGQHIDVGPNWDVRVHLGGQYVRLNTDTMSAGASALASFNAGNFSAGVMSVDFDGFGPRTGLDAKYNLSNGFGLVARTAVSLLVGDRKVGGYSASFSNGTPTVNTTYDFGSQRNVVAGFENRTGLNYTVNMSQGSLVGEIGYAVSMYANPLMAADLNDTSTASSSHFGMNGLYGTIKYVS